MTFLAFLQLTKREDSDEAKIEALSSVAELGEKIWVKIVSVKEEGSGNPKIGASMKLVDQKFGEDKDPTNLRVQEERPTWQPPKKVRKKRGKRGGSKKLSFYVL